MVTTLETELKKGIEEAIQKAKQNAHPVLVSEVQKVDRFEPLSFYAAGHEQYMGERFFWRDPSNQTFLVGLGIGNKLQASGEANRFVSVEKRWEQLKKEAIIINGGHIIGTGPLMFGGFSFDPLKEKTKLWSKYADTLFHLPKYMLSVINGECYVTTNIICSEHDEALMVDRILEERQQLLSDAKSILISDLSFTIKDEKETVTAEEWKQSVRSLVDDLKKGELKKVVLARELRLSFNQDVMVEEVLKNLLLEQKDSFIFAFESKGDCFLGASPERLVKKKEKQILSTCLAGSIGRGKTVDEDEQLGATLLNDEKNLIEHQYVVEMIREAMEKVCKDVSLPERPTLLKTRDIQHLYTPVIGLGEQDSSLLQLVDLLHPTPALGGLPKKEAVEKIRVIEKLDRGFYAAPIGWLDYDGNGEFAVAIRSALIQGNEASLFAGCGIVEDSNDDSEYIETKIKFRPMLSALGGLNNES